MFGVDLCVTFQHPNSYRREEHLAAAIQRSKESRHDSYLRGREEVLAQAITSALGGGGAIERESPVGTGYAPRVSLTQLVPMSTRSSPSLPLAADADEVQPFTFIWYGPTYHQLSHPAPCPTSTSPHVSVQRHHHHDHHDHLQFI